MLVEITTAVASFKSAKDLASSILAASKAYSEAELKLQIADLANKFIRQCDESITVINKLQDEIIEKNRRIDELEEQADDKATLKFRHGVYWQDHDSTPYCPQCYATEKRRIPMTMDYADGFTEFKCSAFPRQHHRTIEGGLQA